MHDVAEAIEACPGGEFLFRLADGCGHTKAEARPLVYFDRHIHGVSGFCGLAEFVQKPLLLFGNGHVAVVEHEGVGGLPQRSYVAV